ncbi:CBD9-like protein [Phellopilus nigrolimitatus]|nr:CBD9-like protein [Phellopilus nigrolimitatus]
MCVSAVVNGSTVEYVLQSTGSQTLGWMAMGFGSQMANSPMVIMWSNSDGSVTLSQRSAPAEVMPTVVSSPPRVATSVPSLNSATGSNPKFGYSIPANSDTTQSIIWAFGTTNPGSSATDATLEQHSESGTLSLDLTKALSSGSSATNPANSGSNSSGSSSTPLLPFQKLVIAHAVLLGIAFLILLPLGALLARWLRTFSRHWFKCHWIIQFFITGPLIVAGLGLGIGAVSESGAPHLDDDHKKWGIVIFVLYLLQCSLGGIIHFVKPRPKIDFATGTPVGEKRPPQNYGHAVLGLLVIALSFYQVRTGYHEEWQKTTGRGAVPNGVNIAWIVWVVLLPILYFAGVSLLPRQYKQERSAQTGAGVPLKPLPHPAFQTRDLGNNGPSTAALAPEKNEHHKTSERYHDDERGSIVDGGDPDSDEVGLTPVGRRNRRDSSRSSRTHTRSVSKVPSFSSARSKTRRPGSATSGAGQVEMRERGLPRAALPPSIHKTTS